MHIYIYKSIYINIYIYVLVLAFCPCIYFLALAISVPRMGSLTMTFTGKYVYFTHHFILLWLNVFGDSADMEG